VQRSQSLEPRQLLHPHIRHLGAAKDQRLQGA
jgi:hypothetical protein